MITFENAKALKEANFPQPEKEFGQAWYSRNGDVWFIGRHATHNVLIAVHECGSKWEWIENTNGFVFAPTVSEILQHKPGYVTDGTFVLDLKLHEEMFSDPLFKRETTPNAAAAVYINR